MSCVALGKAHTLSEPSHSPNLWVLRDLILIDDDYCLALALEVSDLRVLSKGPFIETQKVRLICPGVPIFAVKTCERHIPESFSAKSRWMELVSL